ncbi:hypothetical protein C8F01DRAFT_1150836 [Mycena amicta]|nr:hypothetical protein C8F01DRAFT_1150836 [Mycena amicta]
MLPLLDIPTATERSAWRYWRYWCCPRYQALAGSLVAKTLFLMHWPLKDFRSTAKELAKDPYFKPMLVGAALIVCMELGVNYDVNQYESVKDALLQGSDGFHSEVIPICRPHIELYRTLPAEPEWKACLKNAFDGYRFKVERQTLTAQEQAIARRDLELGPSVVEKR